MNNQLLFYLFYFLVIMFSSCKNTESVTNTTTVDYQGIRSNVARLQAMLAGKYLQLIETKQQDGSSTFETWKVNDAQDSVIMYSVPVGEPNKDGYWLYHYQMMTSLPEEPIYEVFEKLTAIQRDTITSVLYTVPEDFEVTLKSLEKKDKKAFEAINFTTLQEYQEAGGQYVRKEILQFYNELPINEDKTKGGYKSGIYDVHPNHINYTFTLYKDEQKEELIYTVVMQLKKLQP